MAGKKDRLTLDTSVIRPHLDERRERPLQSVDMERRPVVEALLTLAREGEVDLAVTQHVRDDIPHDPLAQEINGLPAMGVGLVPGVMIVGQGIVGRDLVGSDEFSVFFDGARQLAEARRGNPKFPGTWQPPSVHDGWHLHAHYLLQRDVFLTWDGGILCLRQELQEQFAITVLRPEDYLQTRHTSQVKSSP